MREVAMRILNDLTPPRIYQQNITNLTRENVVGFKPHFISYAKQHNQPVMASAYDEIKKVLGMLRQGEPISEQSRVELNRVRRFLEQQLAAAELIEEPLRAFRLGGRAQRHARVLEVADQVALPSALLRRRPGELSGGQCQRVAIARAVGPQPDLLVCDEPASSLDVSVQAQVLRLLVELQGELGLSYLFISHDLAVVRHLADRLVVLFRGDVVERGDTGRLYSRPGHDYTRRLLSAVHLGDE